MTENTMSPFPFLRLARKTRDQIYRHPLSTRLSYTDDYQRRDYSWPIKFDPAILLAKKQLSKEAAQVLYSENDFVLLGVASNPQIYSSLNGFPDFVGLSDDQIPQPALEITLKDLAVETLPQRTFIFTPEAVPYFIEQLWNNAAMCDFYNSMIFELFLFNKIPSRHTFLNDYIVRCFDQLQGFTVLIFHGDIDSKVVRHVTGCMTLGQTLQDVGVTMLELFSRGDSSFKLQDFTLARRYWDRLNSFWISRHHLLHRKHHTPSSITRYSVQDFRKATLTPILKMDLGQRMIDIHTKQFQMAVNYAQNSLTRVETCVNQYSVDYDVPPVLEAKF